MKKLRILIPLGLLALVVIVLLVKVVTSVEITPAGVIAATSLEITPSGGAAGTYSYRIVNQANDKLTIIESKDQKVDKQLSSGSYEVSVSQNSKTFFAIVAIKPHSGKNSVAAPLQAEQQRTFVGDKPDSCMILLGSTLLSHSCASATNTVNTHVPATPTQPTYIDTSPSPLGSIEGTIQTKTVALALFDKPTGEVEEATPAVQHIIYTYNPALPGFQPTDRVVLSDLGRFVTYSIQPYLAGFIAYDSTYTQVFYYASTHSKPSIIKLDKPNTPGLQASSLSASANGEIAVSYTPNIDSGDGPSTQNGSTATEVIVYKGGQSTHYPLGSQYSVVQFCGDSNLCMLNISKGILEINGLSGSKLNPLYTLHNVTHVVPYDHGLLAVRQDGLLKVDTNAKTGFLAYRFGEYQYCGIDTVVGGHVVCLTNPKGNKIALYIHPNNRDVDSIDQKVAALGKMTEVDNISAYNHALFISAKVPMVRDKTSGQFGPDPVIQKQVFEKINSEIDKLKIDRKSYSIALLAS